jgi:hypothetical protein
LLVLAFVDSPTCKIDDRNEQPQPASAPAPAPAPAPVPILLISTTPAPTPTPTPLLIPAPAPDVWPQQESNFGDSSGPLFSLYSKIAKEQDEEMINRWQQDAKGILIFVSGRVVILTAMYINCSTADRSTFCCYFRATLRIYPGPPSQAEFPRYLRILSREHLSGSRPPKCHRGTHIYSFHSPCTARGPILSSETRHLGEFTLVFEPSDQPYMCFLGDVVAIVSTLVTTIHRTRSAVTIQPREASTIACILSGWHRRHASSADS